MGDTSSSGQISAPRAELPGPAARLAVLPTSDGLGTTGVMLTGSGYTGGKIHHQRDLWRLAADGQAATPLVNATGGWTAMFSVPTVASGAKTVSASDNATSPVNATTTFTVTPAVTQTLIGHAVATGGTSPATVPGVATTNGATELILVYREPRASGDSINSITGPFTGTPTQIKSQVVSGKTNVFAWLASGNGTTGTVTVSFAKSGNDATVVDVVQLSGNNTST